MIGLKIPVGVNSYGGAALTEGDDNNNKIISAALGSDENENAFQQDITLGIGMIFDLNDPILRAKILRRTYQLFDLFKDQKRFKIKKDTVKWEENGEELILEFKYVNLESDEDILFRRTFTAAD